MVRVTHITDELEVCIVASGAKHCGVVHLKKREVRGASMRVGAQER